MSNAIWTGTCPHCGRENTAFTSLEQTRVKSRVFDVFFVCNACKKTVVVTTQSTHNVGPHGLSYDITVPGEARLQNAETASFYVLTTYPQPPTHDAPNDVPARIAAPYIEASENLHRGKLETSEMLSRKALDLATKHFLPDSKKKLFGRIEELREQMRITQEMADWAHIIREDGNGAVHDEIETTKENATELLAFTETFLMYSFTLPAMIAKRRSDRQEEEPSGN